METSKNTDGAEATLPVLTPKVAGGSQRVIKQIMVIDPNKLRLAGLDVKMAEALKKSKKKSQPKSKESKLAAAKSVLNKKLKEALSKKDSAKTILAPPPLKSVESVEEVAKKLTSSSDKNKAGKTKPKISVANLKSLMPPPSFPVSSLIPPNQTVEIKVLKTEKTKQSIEVKIVNSPVETRLKVEDFPKASLKTTHALKTADVKLEGKKESTALQSPPELPTQVGADTSKIVIVRKEIHKKKESLEKKSINEKDDPEPDHKKTMANVVEPVKTKSENIVHQECSPKINKSLDKNITPLVGNEDKSLATEKVISAELSPILLKNMPNTTESSAKINCSTPVRRESLPKVIESKVLSPSEKIDLSILNKKSPTTLTVPKKRYKLDQNWISSESNRTEPVLINLSPISKPSSPPQPVAEESAVDFINNLSLLFSESPKNKSLNKSVPEILTKECGEDATSFLLSLFQQKQDSEASSAKESEDVNEASVKVDSKTNEVTEISRRDLGSKTDLNMSKKLFSDLHANDSQNKENNTNKILELAKTPPQTKTDVSQISPQSQVGGSSIQDRKSIISNTNKSKQSVEVIKPPSDPGKTDLNSSLLSKEEDAGLKDVSANPILQNASVNDSLESSVPKPPSTPLSSRRKGSKPIPVLIPKLKKSRKPSCPVEKLPEEKKPQKPTKEPQEESPTQPVQNDKTFKQNVPSELTLCGTEEQKKELPDKSAQIDTHQKGTDKPDQTSAVPSINSRDSADVPEELPTTSRKERPQRQRKMSAKLMESSELLSANKSPVLGIVDKTVEQMAKNSKEPITPTERQRQRKVSFKLSDSTESPQTAVKSPTSVVNTNAQEALKEIDQASKTERPQRQRKITLKLLESSEPLPTMKSVDHVNSRSLVQEPSEKAQVVAGSKTTQSLQSNTEHSKSDNLIAIEMKENALKDPITQLDAFHKSVEQFELACGTVKSTSTENSTPNLELEGNSVTEYPFYDAIVSEIGSAHPKPNQPTTGKENHIGEIISTKSLRKRKDALKLRTFDGEQISIVYSDSLETPNLETDNLQNVPSIEPSKLKEPIQNCQSKVEEVPSILESTETNTLPSKMEQDLSSEPKSMLNISAASSSLTETIMISTPSQSTNVDNQSNRSGQKRRGRAPNLKKKAKVIDKAEDSCNDSKTTEKLNNVEDGSSKTLIPSDECHSQEVTVHGASEVSSHTTATLRNSDLCGSRETLPSADDKVSEEVTAVHNIMCESSKKNAAKPISDSCSSDSKETLNNKGKVEEVHKMKSDQVAASVENSPPTVHDLSKELTITSENETPKSTNKRRRVSKTSKHQKTFIQNQARVSVPDNSIEKETVKDSEIPAVDDLPKASHDSGNIEEVKNQEENDPTSKSMDTLAEKSISENQEPSNTHQHPSEIQSLNCTEQSLSRENNPDSLKSTNNPTNIGSSSMDSSPQVGIDQQTSKANLCDVLMSPTIANEADNDFQEKTKQRGASEPIKVEMQSPGEQSKIDSSDNQNSSEPEKAIETIRVGDTHVSTQESTCGRDLFNVEVLNPPSPAGHTDAPRKVEKKSMPKDDLFDELKIQPNESNEQTKVVHQFDDLTLDLDHIESPSFSPICESSRTSNDLAGFEELDDYLTSAIIESVAAAEKSTEAEKCVNTSVDDEKSRNDTKIKKESKSSSLLSPESNKLEENPSISPEGPRSIESPKSSADKKDVNVDLPDQTPDADSESKKSSKRPKHIEEVKTKSDLKSAVASRSERKTRTSKAKNPFKKKEIEEKSETKSEFLGFNEEEIEEGQQSTSLRLSQSEDVESLKTETPLKSSTKLKKTPKESQIRSGKRQKLEKQKWEKNSANTLKNWLSKPVTSGSVDDICDIKEEDKEQSSSIPLKKRRSKAQTLKESILLEKDVNDLAEDTTDTTMTSETQTDVKLLDKSSNSTIQTEKPKRGRKPKLKNISKVDENLGDQVANSSVPADTSMETPKRRRKSKAGDQTLSVESESSIPAVLEKSNKRKRSVMEECTPTPLEPPAKIDPSFAVQKRRPGRPRKYPVEEKTLPSPDVVKTPKEKKYKDDYEFNPRLLLIRTKEELKSNEPLVDPNLQTEPIGPDDVQCALCMGYTPKKKWIHHVSTHYGIGWIVGNPPPLNINSRGSILSFLLDFYKVSKVKGLNCRLCNSLRRSALGLLMHIEQCCLTEEELIEKRVVCEYCNRNYTKASYLSHKRTCSEYLRQMLQETKTETPETPAAQTTDDVLSNTGRLKRKAVIMAETKLKKLDETTEFVPDDLIKNVSSKNIRSLESIKESWVTELNSFGKGFCASKICQFTATSIDVLADHYQDKTCPYFEKAGYFCIRCKFFNEDIETVRSHVIDKHSPKPPRCRDDSDTEFLSSESSDSILSGDDEGESEPGSGESNEDVEKKPKRSKKSKRRKKRRLFQSKHQPTTEYKKLIPERCSMINIQEIVSRFYDKFIEDNYSLDPLFTFAQANYTPIEAAESYFPKSTDSMKFNLNGFNGFVKMFGKSKVEAHRWKQLERFHGMTENGECMIYLGGPVKDIAWVPLDPHPPTNTQYLAVTVRKGIDKFTRFLNQKRSRSLIFILKFDISLPSEIKAEIVYAIAIDEGPIHTIEFLPSGGYSPEKNRLGILAVGTIETEIKIYSIPLEVEKVGCDLYPIVRLEPAIELVLDVSDSAVDATNMYRSQCTCLIWSQTAGHNLIIASYFNGFVGIWDISDDPDNLNRFVRNTSRRFTPISFFTTTEDKLINLAVHYDMNGPRWLACSNSTRRLMIYDLRDITQPMLLRVEVTINIINCIEWPLVWENVIFGLGDAMPSNGCVISVISPMYIMFATRRFEKFCSGVTDIHFNIWRNCFAAGADNGDVQVTPLREAVLDVAQRLKIDEKMVSTLDIVSLKGEEISQNGIQIPADGTRVFDKVFKDQYGIVFGSIQRIKGCDKPEYYNPERTPPLNLHRLMRVSKIRFNHNKNACDLLAIGYENGLLRVNMREWYSKA